MNVYCAKIAHFLKRGTNLMKTNLITAALLLSASAFVQAETKTELEPINVYSAYATPVNQDQTASSVTVLTEKDFAQRNATYVSDVLKTVPGVAMGISGGRGAATSLFLRGANSKHTAVIIDGIRVNPVDTNFNFGGLPLSNIEQIEVLRGEQSALWGSDAMGGVVYITTKSGLYKDKPFNVDFDFGTGSHRTRDGSVTVSGQQNGFYYALHGDSHRTTGISARSKNVFNYTSISGAKSTNVPANEKDGFHKDNTSIRLGFDDSKKGVDFLVSHSSQTLHFDNSAVDELKFDDNTRIRETRYKLSGYLGSADELFVHKATISHIKTDNNTTQYNSYPSPSVGKTEYDSKKLNTNYQLDINFDREGEIKQAFSVLADYQNTKYIASAYNFAEKKLTEKSVAAEYRLFTEADHSLSVSGRYTDNSLFENAFTARLAGAYRLSQNLKAHVSIGKAIHNPTFIDVYGWGNSTSWAANPNLKPEKSLGGELGLLVESNDKRHSLDTTLFARNVDNFLDAIPLNNTYTLYRSVNRDGKTKIKGVEISYNGKFSESLSGYANYTYTYIKSENDKYGLNYVRRPKHTGNLGLTYQITEKLGSDVNVSYVGKRLDSGDFKMPSYTLANLGVNYKVADSLTIYANLNNVFNKKYENIVGYGQDGRNVYVGLKGSF